jgi:hypothetical protein
LGPSVPSIRVVLTYIPTNSVQVFLSPTSLPAFVVCFINDSHSDWSVMRSQCCFNLHFLYGQGWWVFLPIFTGHLFYFSWELLVPFICSFIQWLADSLWGYFFELCVYSEY